jgi:hypothetical protein
MFLDWYAWLSRGLGTISQPFVNLFYQTDVPLLGALLLGLIASFSSLSIVDQCGSNRLYVQ